MGAFLACTHGMLRWSDAQRTQDLRLTKDAVTGLAAMKNQRCFTPWAAPRLGFSNVDWGAAWFAALKAAGCPGPDFALLGVTKDTRRFTKRIALYKDGQQVMRVMLARDPFGLTDAEAASYTLHGFRHVYTTAMRQIGLQGRGDRGCRPLAEGLGNVQGL